MASIGGTPGLSAMKQQISRVSILQSSKTMTALYVIFGFIYTLIGIPIIIFGDGRLTVVGVIYCLGPVWMGILGFIFFVIFGACYNAIAKRLGGVEFELTPKE
jgi:hypothetical protein